MGYIYIIKNKINDKVYIGQTTNSIEYRWKQHKYAANEGRKFHLYNAMRKYGIDNFWVELLEEVNSQLNLNERESYWIKRYNSYDNGYNSTLGGGENNSSLSKAQVEEIYELWDLGYSMSEISKITSVDKDCISRRLHNYKNFSEEEKKERAIQKSSKAKVKTILLYDLKGQIMKIFSTSEEAAEIEGTSIKTIQRRCREHFIKNEYIWAYEKDDIKKFLEQLDVIYQISKEGTVINIFSKISEATKATGINNISKVLNKKGTAGDFRWERKKWQEE